MAVAVLTGLLWALGAPDGRGFTQLFADHLRFLLWAAPTLGVVTIGLLSVSGVYQRRPTRTHREKLVGVVQSVMIGYSLPLLAGWGLGYGSRVALEQVVLVAFALNAGGSLGVRTAKSYFTYRFEVHRKTPVPEDPIEKVLVIGGAGYIGSVLVRRLLEAGYQVRVLDLLLFGDGPIRNLIDRSDFDLVRGDFRHVDAVIHAVKGMDAVIHLGAIVGDSACALDEETTLQTNYAATALVTDVCKGYGVSRLVFASTCSVYGSNDEIVTEESDLNPVSLYAATKIDSERILVQARSDRFHTTILRLGTAFGWSHRPRFDLVVNLLSAQAAIEKKVVICNEEQWRPFVHVNDIARAFCLMLDAPVAKVSGEVFNVGSEGMNHHLGDVGRAIARLVPEVTVVRESNEDVRNYRVSFAKIHERLGFVCETDLDAGILEIQEQFTAADIKDYGRPVYHNHKAVERTGDELRAPALSLELISNRFAGRERGAAPRELARAQPAARQPITCADSRLRNGSPSSNRVALNPCTSKVVALPSRAISLRILLTAGAILKPCPLKPAAQKAPSTPGRRSRIGCQSGVTE